MPSISEFKNLIHVADCGELDSLKEELDTLVAGNLDMLNYAIQHPYREFNKRKKIICNGSGMITPYDSGYRPIGYIPDTGSYILLEDGSYLLLENSDKILLE